METNDEKPTRREEIEAAWEAVASEESVETLQASTEGSEGEVQGETLTETSAPDGEVATEAPEVVTDGEALPEPEETLERPREWAEDEEPIFRALPKEMQRKIHERETKRRNVFYTRMNEATNAREKFSQEYGALDKVLEPYKEQIALARTTAPQVIAQLFAFSNRLDKDPAGTIAKLMKDKGLNPEAIQKAAQGIPTVDPQSQALMQKVSHLENRLAERDQMQHSEKQGAVASEVISFQNERDETGKPLRPFFNEVWPEFKLFAAALGKNNPDAPIRQVLDAAYERAVRANPDIFKKLQAQEQKSTLERLKQEAAAAAKAGSSIRGAPAANLTAAKAGGSRRDMIAALYDEMS